MTILCSSYFSHSGRRMGPKRYADTANTVAEARPALNVRRIKTPGRGSNRNATFPVRITSLPLAGRRAAMPSSETSNTPCAQSSGIGSGPPRRPIMRRWRGRGRDGAGRAVTIVELGNPGARKSRPWSLEGFALGERISYLLEVCLRRQRARPDNEGQDIQTANDEQTRGM